MQFPVPRQAFVVPLLVAFGLAASSGAARAADAVRYSLTIRDTASQIADLSGVIPTSGEAVVELMMPVWSPGFYRIEDYAGKVQELKVTDEDGAELRVIQPKPNVWRVDAGKRSRILVSYRLPCDRGSVTTNEITKTYAVLNPAGTLLVPRSAVQASASPFELTLQLPAGWTALSALPSPKRDRPWTFESSSYETLVDSPILAGELSTKSFEVEGSVHILANAGEREGFDAEKASGDLRRIVAETRRFWDNSLSGIRPTEGTVSYYVKGDVLGFVLDARIRSATNGRRSTDDLIRLAYERYSGERGFTPAQFQASASEVAGVDLSGWFHLAVASTRELDYAEALDWFGLRFVASTDPERQWSLVVRDDVTPEQERHQAAWLDGQ